MSVKKPLRQSATPAKGTRRHTADWCLNMKCVNCSVCWQLPCQPTAVSMPVLRCISPHLFTVWLVCTAVEGASGTAASRRMKTSHESCMQNHPGVSHPAVLALCVADLANSCTAAQPIWECRLV